MSISKWMILATLVGVGIAGSACTQNAADEATSATGAVLDDVKQGSDTALEATKEGVDEALDATKEGAATAIDQTEEAGEKTAEATRNIVQRTGDKTREIAGQTADKAKEIAAAVGDKSKEVVSATGEAITDGWITSKVSGSFVDETVLKGSNINVDTNNHVVTLKGTVGSEAARVRAVAIARSTEGVTRVVDELVVR